MHLNQINSFLAISQTLNFTSAARQLGIPQSTISRQINDLESQLGVRLFHRTKRNVELTNEGRTFLPYAREISEAASKGSYAVRQLHEGAAGRLSIAVIPAAEKFLAGCMSAFHKSYPDIVIDITPVSGGTILMDDVDSPYDFLFLYRDSCADSEEYDTLVTHREPIGIAMPGDSGRSKAGRPVTDSLPSEKFILLSEEADPILYMQTMNYCRTRRFKPQVVNTFADVSSLLLSVRSGIGISFLPASLISESKDSPIIFRPLGDESCAIDCAAAWKRSLLNPASALFLEVLKQLV